MASDLLSPVISGTSVALLTTMVTSDLLGTSVPFDGVVRRTVSGSALGSNSLIVLPTFKPADSRVFFARSNF